jgi:hypothetical protein
MKQDLLRLVKDIERRIKNVDFSTEARSVEEWEGADVVIKSISDADTEKWLGDQPQVISFQSTEPRRRAVVTKYSKELSWLFYELKKVFSGKIDYVSKYDLYGLLAQSAIDYLANSEEPQGLLLEVLKESKSFLRMNHPDDISLAFFAYGIFKPGQLCYSRIADLVENCTECTVSGILKERDGIPLLVSGNGSSNVKGYLIHFHTGTAGEAYDRITSIEPDEVYRWDVAEVNHSYVNVLVGKREDRGSSDLEHVEEWDGRTDPFFKQGLEEVKAVLDATQDSEAETNPDNFNFRALLRLQMAYTLLWSAIERYAGLKYHLGKKATEKVNQIAGEKCFADALKNTVRNKRTVYSTTDLKKYTLDPSNPKKSIDYYYQVRSNAVHRGKAVIADFRTLKSSLEELLVIFKELLRESFR